MTIENYKTVCLAKNKKNFIGLYTYFVIIWVWYSMAFPTIGAYYNNNNNYNNDTFELKLYQKYPNQFRQ